MGFTDFVKRKGRAVIESQKEKRAFHKQVGKEELVLRREAYKREALRQAQLRGTQIARERANRPSFMSQFQGMGQQQPQRAAPVRRVIRRRPVRRRVVRRAAPVKKKRKRRTTRSAAPMHDPIGATQEWSF